MHRTEQKCDLLRVLFLGHADNPLVRETATSLRSQIELDAKIVLEDFDGSADLSAVEADLAVVFGGDGSILRAARQMGVRQLPVLGVNLGRLGFLADLTPEELPGVLSEIRAGKFVSVEHLMFQCEVIRNDQVIVQSLGLNEAAIMAGPPFAILEVDLYVDREWVTAYRCDGLIISTPIGSTAHSLSAGGPILRKEVQAFVVTPVAAHTLTVRPVVDSADREYTLQVAHGHSETSLVVDGQLLSPLKLGDSVRVRRAEPKFQLIQVPGQSYYQTLRKKLGWAGRLGSGTHET